MITDKDVTKLKKTFVTKDDLKAFATKVNLKEAVDELDERLGNRIDGVAKDLSTVAKDVSTVAKDLSTVLEVLGGISQKLDNRVKEHDDVLEDHEKRLDKVEDKVFSTI